MEQGLDPTVILKWILILGGIYLIGGAFLPAPFKRVVIVNEKHVAILFMLGKFSRQVGPELLVIWNPLEYVHVIVDGTMHALSISESMVTKDQIEMRSLDGMVTWQVEKPVDWAVKTAADARDRISRQTPAAALRGFIGNRTLEEILGMRRDQPLTDLVEQLNRDPSVLQAGIVFRGMNITDFDLPDELERQLADSALAAQEAKATARTADAVRGIDDNTWGRLLQSRWVDTAQGWKDPIVIIGGGSGGDAGLVPALFGKVQKLQDTLEDDTRGRSRRPRSTRRRIS